MKKMIIFERNSCDFTFNEDDDDGGICCCVDSFGGSI
jgi:hypothetical protein